MSEAEFREAEAASAGMLASDLVAAKALTGADRETATASAGRSHLSRVALAGRQYGIATPNANAALFPPVPGEIFDRTDDTVFTLQGNRYLVTVAGTFDVAGTVEMKNAADEVILTFTEAGNATVDLRFQVCRFVLTGVTELVACVKNVPY